MKLPFQAFQIAAAGSATSLTTSASKTVSIPTASDGNRPRFVRIGTNGTIHVRPGTTTSATATTGDSIVTSSEALILNVAGMSYVAGIADSGTPNMQISPIDEGSLISSTTPSGQ